VSFPHLRFCFPMLLSVLLQNSRFGFQEPRSFLFALCFPLKTALLYQPTYSARRAIADEFTHHGR
jgi:hypothetical protein